MAQPDRIGPYRLLERLGTGGMGEVWLAEQREPIRRRVALKLIRAGLDSAQVVARFESERQALALMDHPHIARVLDAGTTPEGLPFFVMEYVEGEPITAFCDRLRLSMRERAGLMVRVCDAIHHAHQRAVIHRDIKPSNVMVRSGSEAPEPKVIDFGVAKALTGPLTERTLLTEAGQIVGTPEYMSPEQADSGGERVDTRTDVYSLGVLFYELLVGALPFDPAELKTSSMFEVLRRIREDEPRKPSTRVSTHTGSEQAAVRRRTTSERLVSELRGDLDWICMKALAKDPARRYGSAADLGRDIQRFLDGEAVLAGPPSTWYRARKFAGKHRLAVAFTLTVMGLLVALAATMAVQAGRIAAERDRANDAAARAERAATTARRVSEFLAQVFQGADPTLTGGRMLNARELLDRGADRIADLADQSGVQAALRTELGGVYLAMGVFDRAAALLEAAVAYHAAHPDDDRSGHACSLQMLALVQDSGQDRPDLAAATARRSVELWERLDDPNNHAIALDTLATALWHSGEREPAVATYDRAIALAERVHGAQSPAVAGPLANLGSLHLVAGECAEAEANYRRALAIEEAQPGAERDHQHGTTLHLLALSLQQQGKLTEAIAAEERSLRIRERVLGPEHWHVALSLGTLGELYRDSKRAAEAAPLQERAVAIAKATWPEGHSDRWWIERSLAQTHIALGRYAEAETVMVAQAAVLAARHDPAGQADALEIAAEAAQGAGHTETAAARRREVADLRHSPEGKPR